MRPGACAGTTATPRNIGQAERVRRPLPGFDRNVGSDADLGEIDRRRARRRRSAIGDIDERRGLERRADALLAALDLKRAGDHGADATDLLPFRRERLVAPCGGNFRERLQDAPTTASG